MDDITIGLDFRIFGRGYLVLGAKSTSHFLAQVFFKLGHDKFLEGLIGYLAFLDPKVWLKNPKFGKKKSVTQDVWFALIRQILVSHNSAADWARELFTPSKHSESLDDDDDDDDDTILSADTRSTNIHFCTTQVDKNVQNRTFHNGIGGWLTGLQTLTLQNVLQRRWRPSHRVTNTFLTPLFANP